MLPAILPVVLATACVFGAPSSDKLAPRVSKAEAYASSESAWPVIEKNCVLCHNATLRSGGIAFDTMNPNALGDHAEILEEAIRRLRGHYMPPLGANQP